MSRLTPQHQRTLKRPAEVAGFGLFTNRDVVVRFEPADVDAGVFFSRADLPGSPDIPATIDFAAPETVHNARRTVLRHGNAIVQMTEHVLAALAGLWIDNCRIVVDAEELPGLDGSSGDIVQALLKAGFEEQSAPRNEFRIRQRITVSDGKGGEIFAGPAPLEATDSYRLAYELDYGAESVIPHQEFGLTLTPETFVLQLASARTFVLEQEVTALQAAGIGLRVTERDVLVFGDDGPIGNSLRFPEEPARHKTLDCVGDFSLIGGDLIGEVRASRSGHALNRQLVRKLLAGAVTRRAA